MRTLFASLTALLVAANMAFADDPTAGDFDYYVLSLSWSPTWCAIEGDDRQSEQCRDDANFGWVLHGLWPQWEHGWPVYCRTGFRAPSRGATSAMADIMGTGGSAWHQWKKHGVCSGLDARDYFRLSRLAFETVIRPPVFRKLDRSVRLPASVIEDAFLSTNPALTPDMITITCRSGRIQEARICLTRDLEPRLCGQDVIQDCTAQKALFDPIR